MPPARRLVRYAISAAIVVMLILFARTVHWGAAWASMRSASLLLLVLALAANFSSIIFRAIRWWLLLRAVGSPSVGLAFRASIIGAGLNNVLIANGGEAARIAFAVRRSGVSTSKILASAVLDRLFDPIGFVALLAVGVTAFDLPPEIARFRWPAVIGVVLIAALLIWLGLSARTATPEHTPERRAAPRGWRARFRAWLVEFGSSMHALATGPRLIGIVALTLLAWIGQLATFALAAAAAHTPIPLAGNLATLLAVNVAGIVRPTPGNVGFFQFAYALAAVPFGVSEEQAIAVSLLIQTLQIIPITLLAVALAPEFLFKRKVPALIPPDGEPPLDTGDDVVNTTHGRHT